MKLNPYSIILIGIFMAIVSITNHELKTKKYEKTTNDSCACFDDSTVFIRQM